MTTHSPQRFIIPLIIPCLLLLAAAMTYRFRPGIILPILPYLLWSITILIGLRYHDTGMLMTGAMMGLACMSLVPLHGAGLTAPSPVFSLLTIFLPLNLLLFSILGLRRLRTPMGIAISIFLCAEILLLWFVGWFGNSPLPALMSKQNAVMAGLAQELETIALHLQSLLMNRNALSVGNIGFPALLMFLLIGLLLFLNYARSRDILLAGYLGTMAAAFIAMASATHPLAIRLYFSAAALALIIAKIEASFSMAYMDELTGLPGRRSLNEAMLNLGKKYAIAMMDIDHFKQFNDTYGHKTGDEVLRMVAAQIRASKGGARTFRYGGEEFTAVFPGKSAKDALPHLEELRRAIETTPFIVRNHATRKKGISSKGKIISGGKRKQVQVTISIGLAEYSQKHNDPGQVIKTADAKLYKAKKAGRNCIQA